ncbi:MAG: glutathione S-transferase [Alphaproteobacteria bacterium]|nr:glutathione S-transferase [Alphaproteobacteria bacterium]HCP00087.1 glutathione S-transferase [Rhodospirillaceae bacterium]
MRFYDCLPAPSPRLVRMFIAEKGLTDTVETVEVDLGEQEQMGETFRAINPFCTVPVLETDGGLRYLTTQGCWRYLEEAHPDPALLGRNPDEKAAVADWIWRAEQEGLLAVADGLRNAAKRLESRALTGPHNYAQIPELAERGRLRVAHFFDLLNATLAEREYLAGDAFTAADIMAFVAVEFADWIKLTPPKDAANTWRWHEQIKERPSAAL